MPMSTVVPAGIFPDLPDCSRESAQNNLGMKKEILNLGTYKQIGKMQPAQPELRPKVLDLFAGAGGMSLGFNNNGMEVKWAVEKGQRCC